MSNIASRQHIHALLFVKRLRDERPLFSNAAALAGQIAEKNPRRVRTLAAILSGILSGKRSCSVELEIQIGNAVYQELNQRDPIVASEITNEILNAIRIYNGTKRRRPIIAPAFPSSQGAEEIEHVKGFLRSVGREGSLVCVEYRDRPRAHSKGKYGRMAQPTAEAIAAGLSFAMFQPFMSDPDSDLKQEFKHTRKVREYLMEVCRLTRDAFSHIRKEAYKIVKSRGESPDVVDKRIVLYERNSLGNYQTHFACGIQSRIFYTIYPSNDTLDAIIHEEVWEWVAGEPDRFVQREKEMAPVVGEQFFPVLNFWHKNGHQLPLSNDELIAATEEGNAELGANLPTDTWTIYHPPTVRI
jgi:hypothetical protein